VLLAVYVQTPLMIGRTGCRESTGIFWARRACLEPNQTFVQSHSVAVLPQKLHAHASMLSSPSSPICSVVFQRVEVHRVVDAVDAVGVKLKLLLQWPF
jgi:hypothetical protein